MRTIRITKSFHFEMAHALEGYDGACQNIHGHSYELRVTIIGQPEENPSHPKLGMVMDFSELKKIVEKAIVKPLDHALVLNQASSTINQLVGKKLFEKMVITPFQPTCENLLLEFVRLIKFDLPSSVRLHYLFLRETPSSYAEWYASDNPTES